MLEKKDIRDVHMSDLYFGVSILSNLNLKPKDITKLINIIKRKMKPSDTITEYVLDNLLSIIKVSSNNINFFTVLDIQYIYWQVLVQKGVLLLTVYLMPLCKLIRWTENSYNLKEACLLLVKLYTKLYIKQCLYFHLFNFSPCVDWSIQIL